MSSGWGTNIAYWMAADGFAGFPERHELTLRDNWGPDGASSRVEFPDGSSLEVRHNYGRVEKHEVEITIEDGRGATDVLKFFYDTDSQPLAVRFIGTAVCELWEPAFNAAVEAAEEAPEGI